jgi:phage replication initiation protein
LTEEACLDERSSEYREFIESVVLSWFGEGYQVHDRYKGWCGYKHSFEIVGVGFAACVGNSNTVHFEITGQGCAQIKDWEEVKSAISFYAGKITRCDVAADDFEGSHYSIDWCRKQYLSGGFKGVCGVMPDARSYNDEGSGKGCTYYVGSRSSGKLFRGYEKGKQSGYRDSKWFRVEVEYRAVHRVIPIDILDNPGAYLAGSYPCLAHIDVRQDRIKTFAFVNAATLRKAVEHARKQAGRSIYALLELNGGDICDAISRVLVPKIPKRLVPLINNWRSGLLPGLWRREMLFFSRGGGDAAVVA